MTILNKMWVKFSVNKYKEVAIRDIEKMQEAGARAHETDTSGAAVFKASII